MIMVVGIVAKNGILMLDTVEENLHSTGDLIQALILSGRRRFRPVPTGSARQRHHGQSPNGRGLGAGSSVDGTRICHQTSD